MKRSIRGRNGEKDEEEGRRVITGDSKQKERERERERERESIWMNEWMNEWKYK